MKSNQASRAAASAASIGGVTAVMATGARSPSSPSPSQSLPAAAASPLAGGSGLLPLAAPHYELEIPGFASAATTLAITITGLENPAAQGFAVRASLSFTGQPDLVLAEIGRVIPRQPDAAGTFLLVVPAPARAWLGARDARLRLRLRLQPTAPGAAFDAHFKVRIAAPRWY